MQSLKKILVFILIFIMIFISLMCCNSKITSTSNINMRKTVNIAVLLYSFDDLYMSKVKKTLEDIQMKNEGKVKFVFYDGKKNQAIQETIINNIFETGNFDILFVDLVNKGTASVKNVIDKAETLGIPVIFTYVNPETIEIIKSYNKAFVIGEDEKQAGELQGKIIIDIWNTNKESIDKDNDNKLEYIMLQGSNELAAKQRVLYTISAINNAGIKTESLASIATNWDRELTKSTVNSLFFKYDGKIESIISNSDDMAIGAIEALQQYGYNTGNKSKTIIVVGIDGIPEARELINKGYMAGTVIQDPRETAEAFYTVGMNLLANKSPIEGTNYKLDKMGVTILLPYQEYIEKK
ncbi:galactose ABC transporter substrate-binding protein [uncultured Clostridium sp.]|uniref:galactose ABC transporter substrate-binding protein n=1 Tax=uncultured Clostridium sp. TaxID=59620 RepID=UPI0028EA5FFE|nr:galactose ABC transporter substrate-binding protein [uncultured Clostridium sp.]